MNLFRKISVLAANFGSVRHSLATLAGLYSGSGVFDALGGLTEEETDALVRRAAAANLDVVEIGTLFGFTARALAAALPAERKIYAVDNFSWNPFGLPPSAHESFTRKILEREIADGRVEIVNADSEEFLKTVRPDVFLFLDGDHRREAVKAEIEAARAAGVRHIAGHDWGNPLFGVAQAVEETLGAPDETAGMCWFKTL